MTVGGCCQFDWGSTRLVGRVKYVSPAEVVVRIPRLGGVDPTTGKYLPKLFRLLRDYHNLRSLPAHYEGLKAMKIKKKAKKEKEFEDKKSGKLKAKKKKGKRPADDDEDDEDEKPKKKKNGNTSVKKDPFGNKADTRTSRINMVFIKGGVEKKYSTAQIEEKADAKSIHSHLSKLMSQELIKKVEGGKYALTKKGAKRSSAHKG